VPRILQDHLDSALKRCKESQDAAIEELGKYDVNRASSKWKFGIWGNSSLRKKFNRFKSDLDELDKLCFRMSFVQQTSSNLLRPEYFKLIHESAEHQPGGVLPLSDIWVVTGCYEEPGQRHHGDFILEKKYSEVDVTSLSDVLRQAPSSTGILPCLGYRQPLYNDTSPPYRSFLQLVLELPPNTNRQSLAHKLYTEAAPTLSNRVSLAKLLTQAVRNVHDIGLVHKSIRSRAILFVVSTDPNNLNQVRLPTQDSSPQLFLQDWTYVRRQTAATSQNGTSDAWQRRIYEHPERQRSRDHFPETDYQPKHDIYSLGVVFVEIFLWMSFVQPNDCKDLDSELAVAKIYEETALGLGEDLVPQRYKGNSQKLTRFPAVIRDVWVIIAKSNLGAVNEDLGQVVVGCLEGKFVSAREVLEALEKVRL
jgi:hypothetical protein